MNSLMRSVLADLSIESEAAVVLWMRLAAALDNAAKGDKNEQDFIRLATAISKYWVCKRAPTIAYEAMECHGGNGYVEEGPMAALFRQSPLNAIWEGSGNIICLDVLRAAAKEPASVAAVFAELEKSNDVAPKHYSKIVADLKRALLGDGCSMDHLLPLQSSSRGVVDRLAVCLQATTLYQHGDAWLQTHLWQHDCHALTLVRHVLEFFPCIILGLFQVRCLMKYNIRVD